jgi:hypothetical protein
MADVLELLLACILEGDVEFVPDLPVGIIGDANAAKLGNALQSCRDVDAIAVDVPAVRNDVSQVDPDAELDALLPRPSVLRSPMPRWISTAQRTASTTLLNSASSPSPVFLTTRPLCSAIFGWITMPRWSRSRRCVPSSSRPVSLL